VDVGFPIRSPFLNTIRLSGVVVLIGSIFPLLSFGSFLRFLKENRAILILGALFLLSGLASAFSSPFPRSHTIRWLFLYGFAVSTSFGLLFLFSTYRGLGTFFLKTVSALAVLLALVAMVEVGSEELHGFLCDVFRGGERRWWTGSQEPGRHSDTPILSDAFCPLESSSCSV